MKIADPNDTMILTGIINAISVIAHDLLIIFRDMIYVTEAEVYCETIRAIVLTSHAHREVLTLEIDVHFEIMNIHELTHSFEIWLVLDVVVHIIHLQLTNVLYH